MIFLRRWPRTWRRVLLWGGALVVLLLALAVAALETGAGRSALLGAALRAVERQTGFEARADRFEVAILRREALVRGFTLSPPGSSPFIRIAEARLSWPILTLGDGVVPETVVLEGVRVDLRRGPDGRWSVPGGSGSTGAAGAPVLPLRTSLRDVAVTVSDAASGTAVEWEGISLEASGTRRETQGTLAAGTPLRWRTASRSGEVAFGPAAFRLGRSFTLETWQARAREGNLSARGSCTDVFGAGRLAFDFEGDLDLARLAAAAPDGSDLEGELRFDGRVEGTLDAPVAPVTWSGRLTASALGPVDVEGRTTLTPTHVDLDDVALRVASGTARARGRIVLDSAEASRLEADWAGLDLARLLGAPWGTQAPVASALSGRLSAVWPALAWLHAEADVLLEATAAADAGRSLGVTGQARLGLHSGSWTLDTDTRAGDAGQLVGHLEGRLDYDDVTASSLRGRLDLALHDLRAFGRAFGRPTIAGRGGMSVIATGTLARPQAAVELRGVGVSIDDGPSTEVAARGIVRHDGLVVDDLDLHAGSAHVQGAGRLRFADGAIEARYEADLPDLGVLEGALPAGFAPGGALHGQGRISGAWPAPRITLSADGSALRLAGQAVESARFELGLADGQWNAEAVELVQEGSGRLRVAGRYDPREGRLTLAAHGRGFEIGALPAGLVGPEPWPLGGTVDVDFEGSRFGTAATGGGRLTMTAAQWQGRGLGVLTLDLGLRPEGLRAKLAADDFALRAEGLVGLEAPFDFSLTARLEDSDLAAWTRAAGADAASVSGRASAVGTARGTLRDPGTSAVSLAVETLDARLREVPLRIERAVRLSAAPGELRVEGLDVAVGEGRVRLDGGLDDEGTASLRGSVEGGLGEYARLAGLQVPAGTDADTPAAPSMTGAADATFSITGPLERPAVAVEARVRDGVLRLSRPDFPPIEGLNARASVQGGTLRLEQAEATWSGAKLTASGDVTGSFFERFLPARLAEANRGPGAQASFKARLEGDAGQVLAPILPGTVEGLGRTAVLTVDLAADAPRIESVRGEIRLEGADLRLNNVALSQSGPATVVIDGGRLAIGEVGWKGLQTALSVTGTAQAGPQEDPFGGATVDGALSGDLDLQLLQVLGRGIETGGTGLVRLRARGPLSSLQTEGEVRLSAGTLRHRATRFALDGLVGTLRWDRSGFVMDGVQGSLNGGPIEASGALRARESGRGFEGAIRIQARSTFLEWPPGLRARLRTNLTLEPAGDALRLSGTLRILDGTYRTREYFSLQVLELVERFSRGSPPSRFDPLQLDVSVRSAEDALLDALDGRLLVGVDLRLSGSVGAPEVGGRLTAAPGGQVFMSGRTYDVDSAVLDFSRGAGFEPYVQAQARTRVSDYTVLADVAGPATRAKTRLASNPPLGQQDIVALLTSGRTVGAGGTTGGQTDALSMASGGMLGKTGQVLGLDSLKIESNLDFDPTLVSSETDPSSRLTFSKRLAANLSGTFSRSLTKTGGYTWFLAWKPKPPIEVRVVQHDDQTGALEFRHDVTIGGGQAAPTPVRRRRRRSGETVIEVRITGDDGAARVSDLRLQKGHPFDYDTWLEDRDRLEEKLGREGYAEARVLASRETPPSEEGAPRIRQVALVYDLRRGPRTRLVIQGVASSDALRTRIERAWRLGEYESSIEEEAETLTRADLYEKGHLRARVEARLSISPSGEEKALTVTAEPGAPVRAWRVAFEGNSRVPRPRLEALVKDPARAAAAWLRPEDLRRAVVELYEREGLLAARVDPPRVVFSGDEARLVVRIDEGPVVPIVEVSLKGAHRLGTETVLSAAALATGQPFKPADVESARARVEAAYRHAGFNEATARIDGRLDAASGTMRVEVQVTEGVREVLEEVAVSGGGAGLQAKARRELRLTPGEPVVLDEWTEARRRIYETGLFRRVDLEPAPSSTSSGREGDRLVKANLKLLGWPALRLRYGLQLVTTEKLASEEGTQELQLGGVAELTRRTLFGHAVSTGLSVQGRKDEQEGRGFVSVPRTFGTPVRSSLFLTVTRDTAANDALGGDVETDRTELTWEERIRATRTLDFAGAYKLQWTHFELRDPAPELEDGGQFDARLSRVVGTALLDRRNDLINTTRGTFSSLSFEWGGSAIGSDYPLKRIFLQQFAYIPLFADLVFGAAGRAERASGTGSALLEDDRLEAGGANTVRGYTEEALVQRGLVNFLGGSTALFVLNGELRFPVRGPVKGVLFGDGAILRAKLLEETTRESIWSTGIGLRYVTAVGILRLDFGIPLDEGFKPKRGRVYFSLGQVF